MRHTMKPAGPILPVFLFTLTGCFSLGRTTPTLEQYVLGGAQVTEAETSSPNRAGLTIGLRRLDLAAYLATPAVVVRRGAHQIVTSEFHRWGEDPVESINRAFGRYLADGALVRAVDIAPWPVRSQYDYLIQLHVSRFEGAAPEEASATAGEAHVVASWEIIRQLDGAVLARGATDHRESGWRVGDYAGLVALLDRGLNVLARDLEACLQSLGPATLPPVGTVERAPPLTCGPQTQ